MDVERIAKIKHGEHRIGRWQRELAFVIEFDGDQGKTRAGFDLTVVWDQDWAAANTAYGCYFRGELSDASEPVPVLPCSPDNAFVESFNGRFHDECMNTHWFLNLAVAKGKIEAWRWDFNETRPHTSLGFMTLADEAPESSFGLDANPGQGQSVPALHELFS